MINAIARWFRSKPFAQQIIVLALVFDPIGFVGGYLLGPSFGLDPLIGAVFGLVIANIPASIHVMNASQQAG